MVSNTFIIPTISNFVQYHIKKINTNFGYHQLILNIQRLLMVFLIIIKKKVYVNCCSDHIYFYENDDEQFQNYVERIKSIHKSFTIFKVIISNFPKS